MENRAYGKGTLWDTFWGCIKKYFISGPLDYSLFFTVVFLNIYGIIMIYSASYNNSVSTSDYFVNNQVKNVLLGLVAMVLISFINYHRILSIGWGWGWFVISIAIIAALRTPLGHSELGATRWIYLGPIRFQAAEPIKAAMILFFAFFIKKYGLKTWKLQLTALFLLAVVVGMIFFFSNNMSAFIIIAGICGIIIMSSVKRPDIYCYVVAIAVVVIVAVIAVVIIANTESSPNENFRITRIRAWLNPEDYASDEGLQAMQARYAIGAGGFWGRGLGQSLIKYKLSYSYNDFILAIICEELGVFGVMLMMGLFGYLLYRIYRIAVDSWDIEGKIIAIGVFAQVGLQLLINVMVVLSWIPTTGVTLPFFSAGGTSVVFLLAELGIVLNVDKYSKERRFREEAKREVESIEMRAGIGAGGWKRRLSTKPKGR